jgi:hypothetical protein
MTRFYPIAVEIDGHRHSGDWTLMPGGRVCVRSWFGSQTVEIGRATPEVVAVLTLERIIRASQKRRAQELARQARELAKLRKRRKAMKSSPDGHAPA